jgi:hypothetical protein
MSRQGSLEAPGRKRAQVARLIRAIRESDETVVDEAIVRLSRSRRWLAPLALAVGALLMLYEGVKLLFINWRLTLIQVLPAMWIWIAMTDLKAHTLHGKDFHPLSTPLQVAAVTAIVVITAASFFLNAVFAYAIARPGPPLIRPAFTEARSHLGVIVGFGAAIGVLLGVSAVVVFRWGLFWFTISLGIVVGVMMVCYVAVPARLVGMKTTHSRRDKLAASAVSGVMGAVVCTPPYLLGRLGLAMLGSSALFIPGIIVFSLGAVLQTGATSAVKAVKMSAKLVSGHRLAGDQAPRDSAAA